MKCEKQRIIVAVIRVFSCCDDLKMLWWDDDVKKNQVKPPDIDSKKLNSSLFYPTWSSSPPFFFVQCSLLLSRWNNSERKLGWINFCWIKVQSNHFTHCTDSVKKIWDLIDVTLSDRNAFSKVGANKTNYSSMWSVNLMVMVWSILEKNFSSEWRERSQQPLFYICTAIFTYVLSFSHGDKRKNKRLTSWT